MDDIFTVIIIAAIIFFAVRLCIHTQKKVSGEQEQGQELNRVLQQETDRKKAELQKNREEQAELVRRYQNSPLTMEILNHISGGDVSSRKPEEIIITDNGIQGVTAGVSRAYSFLENRAPSFQSVFAWYGGVDNTKEEDIVRPQMAMAEAINHLLGESYYIVDRACRHPQRMEFDDSEGFSLVSYESKDVKMTLKPNKIF